MTSARTAFLFLDRLSPNRLTVCLHGLVAGLLAITVSATADAHRRHQTPRTQTPVWFTHAALGDGIWTISDNGVDRMYLVEGQTHALLVDTGVGFADINAYARSLTDLPLLVVNSHAHPDHAGGNTDFHHVHLHADEPETLAHFTSKTNMRHTYNAFLDRPLPERLARLEADDYPELTLIQEGFVFELGQRNIEVLHTPGHTPGSIVLHDLGSGAMLTGDTVIGRAWLHPPLATSVEDFLMGLERIEARRDRITRFLPGHGEPLPVEFLDSLIGTAEAILSGACEGESHTTHIGAALLCEHEGAGIVFDPARIHNPD